MTRPKPLDLFKLEPGTTYAIDVHDCCVTAHLVGTFVELLDLGFADGSGNPATDIGRVVFDIGTFDGSGGGWSVHPADTDLGPI